MSFLGPVRTSEAGVDVFGSIASSPRQPMNKASPRGITGAGRGFPSVSSSKVAEVRPGRPLRRSNAVDNINLDISPPGIEPLSKAAYVRGSSLAASPRGIETSRLRGLPLVEWVWPSNASIANMGESGGATVAGHSDNHNGAVSPDGLLYQSGRAIVVGSQENGKQTLLAQQQSLPQQARPAAVVIGKVCEPVRPTRLDFSGASEARTPSSRVIYTAKGGHNLNLDAPATPGVPTTPLNATTTTATTTTRKFFGGRPSAIRIPALEEGVASRGNRTSGGHGRPRSASGGAPAGAWFRTGGNNGRARSRAGAGLFSGFKSPRYLNSTTLSQAKTIEPPGGAGAPHRHRQTMAGAGEGGKKSTRPRPRRRASVDEEHGLVTGNGDGTCGSGNIGSRDVHVGSGPFEEEDGEGDGCVGGCAGVGGWGAAGLVEQIGGFFRLTRGNGGRGSAGGGGDRTTAGREHGFEMPPPRTPRTKAVASATRGGATAATVSSRTARLSAFSRSSTNGASIVTKSATKVVGGKSGGRLRRRVSADGKGKPLVTRSSTVPEQQLSHRPRRRDERPVLTINTPGVAKPEGLRFRFVKASGRALNDTLFHIEIRTLRPGQVWSVCRKYGDFQRLHAALQEDADHETTLPRLPRPPLAGPLEPATLERARAALQAYAGAVASEVPSAWRNEEFVMFMDADEKGRRLFARKRMNEPRRVPLLPQRQDSAVQPVRSMARATAPPVLFSPTPDSSRDPSFLDVQTEEKQRSIAAKEGEAQNHFDGVGAVINTLVSFSDDDECDLGLDDDDDFIDGEDAIRAMLDRDAEEAEDDNLFTIPAGTDFGALDDDIDDDFDLTYRG